MKFSIEIKEIVYWKLTFNYDCPQIDYKPNLPLLVDTNGLVLIGSSFRKHFDPLDMVSCILTEPDGYLTKSIWEIEKEIVLEQNINRIYEIESEFKNYLDEFKNPYESFTLFDNIPDDRLITKENYIDPGDYDYIKHNIVDRKDVDEEDLEYAGLFSNIGEY
jgi:hypothetical protein